MNDRFPSAPAIHVANLGYSFKDHRALQNVSFDVAPRGLHGFVGPNGAGKTTTLKVICTLLRPQAGTVSVFGHNVVREVNAVRRRIGFMPDHFSMYRQMTVYEYLDFFGAAYGLSLSHRDRVIADVLELTDMAGRKDDLISSLSRGMQQRVSLARVLVNDPDLLLLDEPASGLDPRARIELMDILRALRSMGKTIFISSHILSELAELCDSVTIIDRGQVKFSGPMAQLLALEEAHPTYDLTLAEIASGVDDRLRGLAGVVTVENGDGSSKYQIAIDLERTDVNRLLRGVLDLGLPIAAFTKSTRHLNQAFLDLTQPGVRE